jgi:hypothetical protein
MNYNKRKLRIFTFFCVLIFLIIPLFSTQVSAFHYFAVGVETDNKAGPPTPNPTVGLRAGYPTPGLYTFSDDGSGVIIFVCDAYIQDTTPPGRAGSTHYVELNVQKILPTPVGPLLVANTGIITLAQGQQHTPYPQPLVISTTYTTGGGKERFCVWVYAECTDTGSGVRVTNTWFWYVDV